MKKILVYTDGSCLGNPGPGGWAFIVISEPKNENDEIMHRQSGKDFSTTNNRMEMKALMMSLKYLVKEFSEDKIQIHSDSNLLVQTINLGWKKKANRDLWLEIDKLLPKLNLEIFWVKAHHKDKYNNLCDRLAFREAEKAKSEITKKPWLAKEPSTKDTNSSTVSTSSRKDQPPLF